VHNENLLPDCLSERWKTWFQRNDLSPEFIRSGSDCQGTLGIVSTRFVQYGKWLCAVSGIRGGDTYDFSVEFRTEKVLRESASLHGMLTWINKEGIIITRDYADKMDDLGNGWKSLSRKIDSPEKAESLLVELAFKWTDNGAVTWRNPMLCEVEPLPHRIIKAASAFIEKNGTLDFSLRQMLAVIDKAGAEKADILCLGETVYDWGVDLPLDQRAVTIPGPLTEVLSERAVRHNMYIVLSLNESEGGLFYNTGLLIDRKGAIAGKYRKMQLPLCEGEDGITPGRDYPVFDTDFGRIGILICWDHGFPEVARILARKGAEILFLPTLWHTEIQAPARAVENGVYVVVSAPRWSKVPCRIISPEGEVIASAMGGEYNENGICTATIDLDKRFYTFWTSVGAAFGEAKSCFMQERRTDTYGLLSE
jgi:predicted amidohydrolase